MHNEVNRVFAVLCEHACDLEKAKTIENALSGIDGKTIVFCADGVDIAGFSSETAVIPKDADTSPKRRNWLNSKFRADGFKGFLHVLESRIDILDGAAVFVKDIENTMRAFDYPVWMSTISDRCNYVYGKYAERLRIRLDGEYLAGLGLPDSIGFTSNANTAWMIYDFKHIDDELLRFDESFTIPMFWILEFMSRRRRVGGIKSLFFMNQYLTCPSERGAYGRGYSVEPDDSQKMQSEQKVFRSRNIMCQADNDADELMRRLWRILENTIQTEENLI